MRVGRDKRGRVVLAGVMVLAMGIFCWTAVQELQWTNWEPSTGSARLVSMEQLPDNAEFCATGEAVSAIATLSAEFEDNNLFSAFGETVHAADTVEVNRPPVRMIHDTYPIYSSVAVDPVRDEVVLQDTNLFGIKVFNRTGKHSGQRRCQQTEARHRGSGHQERVQQRPLR